MSRCRRVGVEWGGAEFPTCRVSVEGALYVHTGMRAGMRVEGPASVREEGAR
jgi:hypothetical protein